MPQDSDTTGSSASAVRWKSARTVEAARSNSGRLAIMAWAKDPANRDAAIKTVGAELKLDSKQATESVDELSNTGVLNLPGLQVVLDLRKQFGFKLAKGDKLPVYYDASYFNAARTQ